jgi:hypothetical protein
MKFVVALILILFAEAANAQGGSYIGFGVSGGGGVNQLGLSIEGGMGSQLFASNNLQLVGLEVGVVFSEIDAPDYREGYLPPSDVYGYKTFRDGFEYHANVTYGVLLSAGFGFTATAGFTTIDNVKLYQTQSGWYKKDDVLKIHFLAGADLRIRISDAYLRGGYQLRRGIVVGVGFWPKKKEELEDTVLSPRISPGAFEPARDQ